MHPKPPGLSEYYLLAADGPYDFKLQTHAGPAGQWAVSRLNSENVQFAAAQRNFWVCASRGARSFSIHAPGHDGKNLGVYHMFGPPQITWRRQMFGLKYAIAEFARIRGEVEGAKPVSQIALLEMHESIAQTPGSAIQEDVGFTGGEQRAIFEALHNPIGMQSDPISPDADLSRYRVLIVSQGLYLSRRNAERLRKYVEGGGVLLATGPIGLFDEHGFRSGTFLREVAGVDSAHRGPLGQTVRFPDGPKIAFIGADAQGWRFQTRPDAQVLAGTDRQSPAVVTRKVGRGRAIVTGYGLSQTRDIPTQLRKLVLPHVTRPARTQRPVHLFFLKRDGKYLVYAYNREVKPVRATLDFPRETTIDDLRAGVRLRARSIPLDLAPGECRVFRFE
jgi:hypothetical protein